MIHIALKAALLSSHKQRVGAVVHKNGRVLATACNSVRHKKGVFKKKWINSLHAEQAALLMLSEKAKKGASLSVCRVKANGCLGLAKPCVYCKDLIISSGIKEVFYTDENGFIVKWRVK